MGTKSIFYLLFLFPLSLHAQLHVGPGANIIATNGASITVNNTGLSNSGSIAAATDAFVFTGTSAAVVTGIASTTPLAKLIVNKSSGGIKLASNLNVTNTVQLTSGIVDLNGFNLDLGTTGVVNGESNTAYITGTTGGYVQRTVTLNAPSASNPGNLGLEITSAANMGSTIIRRGHQQQTSIDMSGYSIYRYYDVLPANNTGLNANIRFYYLDGELAGFNESTLLLFTSANYSTGWQLQTGTSVNSTANYLVKSGLGSLNRLTLGSTTAPLPLQLLSFSGNMDGSSVQLNWITTHEENVRGFELEKSSDAVSFKKFAMQASSGSLSGGNNEYTATDYEPFNPVSCYRLKIISNDGSYSYSPVISIKRSMVVENALRVFPNPACNKLYLSFSSKEAGMQLLQIVNQAGQVVQHLELVVEKGVNNIPVEVTHLAAGVYFLQLSGGQYGITKFIKGN